MVCYSGEKTESRELVKAIGYWCTYIYLAITFPIYYWAMLGCKYETTMVYSAIWCPRRSPKSRRATQYFARLSSTSTD